MVAIEAKKKLKSNCWVTQLCGFLWIWKGYWSGCWRDTLQYYSPGVGSSYEYLKIINHWLWNKATVNFQKMSGRKRVWVFFE
jgi:hypothetical protein